MGNEDPYLEDTFRLFRHRPVLYYASTVVPYLAPWLILFLVGHAIRPFLMPPGASGPPNPIEMYQSFDWTTRLGVILAFLFMASLAHAASASGIARLTWEECEGRALTALDLATATCRLLLPLTALAFTIVTGTFVGDLLLLVPGLWFSAVAGFAIPAATVEKPGPLRALQRSFRLTRGHHIELMVIFFLAMLVVEGLQILIKLIPDEIMSKVPFYLSFSLFFAVVLLLPMFLGILLTLLYRHARIERETVQPGC
jgi:hypothetical protein